MDWRTLQSEWDAQQTAYMPDREERFTVMLDVVEATCDRSPRVLDLAGGTGSITLRLLARMPEATSVIADVDPALLAIAGATFAGDGRARVCAVDLATPAWVEGLATAAGASPGPSADRSTGGPFDAVLTATALHWLPEHRVAEVYREAATLLRPGGVLANADHMPDPGLTGDVTETLEAFAGERSRRHREQTGALDWDAWWARLAGLPELADAVGRRNARFADRAGADHTESTMSSDWHVAAMLAAGCAAAGLVWRGLGDAVAVGVLPS